METVEILGINTTAQPFAEAVETLARWAQSDTPRYVCTCPVYTLMMGVEQAAVREALNNAAMVTADGMPVVWVQRRLGARHAERVYGPDIVAALCERGVAAGLRHYFYGGAPGVAEQVAARVQDRFPGLAVAGTEAPPFAPVSETTDASTVQKLNAAGAHVIWVGLGSPKQDVWMMRYRPALTAPLLIGVGAAFDFIAGTKRQAPPWMRRGGLEWAFRLAQEPGRLWQRYLIYNARFVWQIGRHHLFRNIRREGTMSDEARYADLAQKGTEELQALKHELMRERSRHPLARAAEDEAASAPDEPEAWERLVIAIDQILVARRGRG